MAFLPQLKLFGQLEEFMVKCDKAPDDSHRVANLVGLLWREDHSDGRLRASFQHVLSFFIEARRDGVPVLESYEQGW
jgi:hypothetical protein